MTVSAASRVSGIMARDAPIAVLLRFGSKGWCEMILWHTDTDELIRGQWVHHPVEVHSSGLSPDGKLLLYRGFKPWAKYQAWIGISRPPCFTCLALWPASFDCGGLFVENRQVVLWGPVGDRQRDQGNVPLKLTRLKTMQELSPSHQQLLLGGWRPRKSDHPKETIWERAAPRKRWTLQRRYGIPHAFDGTHSGRYAVHDEERLWELPDATWADVDQSGRLVFTEKGKLFTAKVTRTGIERRELADFQDDKPAAIPPPDWATHWPR